MKHFYILINLILIGFMSNAQISVTNIATPYNQDFNTLEATATTTPSAILPTGWSIFETGTSSLVDQKYKSDNGGLNSGDTYSYGITAITERSLGALQSGTNAPSFGVKFQNNSGAIITSVTISFTGEEWRLGVTGGRKDTLDFQYGINNADLGSGSWNNVDALDFTSPNTTGTVGALDGNAAANKTALSFTITSLNIAIGDFFYLKFVDRNIAGSDDGLGIDDLTVNFTGAAPTPCVTPTAQATGLSLTPTANSISGTFTAASPTPSNYLIVYSTSSTLASNPVDGTTYTTGQTIGGGTVVQYSSTNNFTINTLNSNTAYFVFIFSANSAGCTGGPKYLTTTPLTGTATTTGLPACTTPTAAATNLILSPTATSISGSFTASASANRYLVIRSISNTLSASPVNGTTYVAGAVFGGGTIVQYGTSTSFSSIGLTPVTTYYYFVFAANGACTGEPFYLNTSLNGNTATLNNNATGYYNTANGLSCQTLKTALYNITSTGTTVLSYTPGVWNAYQTTDLTRNFENTADIIYDMYSNKGPGLNEPYEFTYGTNQCGNYSGEGQCYNREHSLPQSWFNSASPMVSDIHHIVPTDGSVNGQRGNFPFGPVGTPIYTSQNGSKKGNCSYPGFTGTVFEPINEFKGDFARMQFYMAVRYENVIGTWQNNGNANEVLDGSSYQVFDAWYLKMLFDWHQQDPVSAKEIARNNAVFAIQGNRNPFIDSAHYAYKIWSCTGLLPSPIAIPILTNISNKCFNDASAKGKATNPPVGATVTVTLDGNAIAYNNVDSSFQYFTTTTTTVGNHTVRVTYTNGANSAFKDSIFTVFANVTPLLTITGNTTVNVGQASTINATPTNGGVTPTYQWQDSVTVTGWVNITGATANTINYTPSATGVKLRCIMTSNANCITTAQATSNVLSFTVSAAAPPVPIILNVANKCQSDATARGKLANPPATATIAVTLDGTAITYNVADSSFQYFTNSTTTAGNHTVRATYTTAGGTTFKDSVYMVTAPLTPSISIAGTTVIFAGQLTTLTATPANGGTTPQYQWQDSTSAAGWVNISGATNAIIVYTPTATGHKIRCRLTSNATGCVNLAPVVSNTLVFTVNATTAITPINGANFGIQLFPNPIQKEIGIYAIRVSDKWQTIEVVSINGRKSLLKRSIQNLTQVKINAEGLPAGMYYVILRRTTGANAYIKMIKL
jgi:endonuclease I